MTLIALSLRLADHLVDELRRPVRTASCQMSN